jgi:topoisomerase (DNA) II binding protein 1
VLKKPIVTINWLYQCWNEHRVVPQESYRVLPFSGLTICVTRIPAGYHISYFLIVAAEKIYFSNAGYLIFTDKRKEIEKLIIQNGGKYSAELTKKCTHLISDISFPVFLRKPLILILFYTLNSQSRITAIFFKCFFC